MRTWRAVAGGVLLSGLISGCGAGTDSENDSGNFLPDESGGSTSSGGFGTGASASGGAASGGAVSGGTASGGAFGSGSAATGGEASGGSGSGGEATGGASTGGAASGGSAATGGASTGGSTSCSEPSVPTDIKNTVDLTWTEMTGGFEGKTGARPANGSVTKFKNLIFDQILAGEGTLRYCIRNESTKAISSALRTKIQASLERAINKWTAELDGYGCFPYPHVDVEITGFATKNRDLLQWADDGVPIYVNQNDGGGAPMCPDACSRFAHQQDGYTYPSCSGGYDNHFDMSLWLTDNFGFVGGDWGQRMDRDSYVNSVDTENQHILIHEMGHGFGFPDYYNWNVWAPGVAAPACVMNAGAAAKVTTWDSWMLKRTWTGIRSRFSL